MNLHDRLMIFHDYAGCPGMIVSSIFPTDEQGDAESVLSLKCNECGATVGYMDEDAMDALLGCLPPSPALLNGHAPPIDLGQIAYETFCVVHGRPRPWDEVSDKECWRRIARAVLQANKQNSAAAMTGGGQPVIAPIAPRGGTGEIRGNECFHAIEAAHQPVGSVILRGGRYFRVTACEWHGHGWKIAADKVPLNAV